MASKGAQSLRKAGAGLRLFTRHKRLLALLDALGGRANNRNFQKWLFLYCQEITGVKIYDFVPYKFGAFSFTSNADRRKLIAFKLIVDDEQKWELTNLGRRIARENQELQTYDFAQRYRKLRGNALIAETYRRFPYYATRSEIIEDVLPGDKNTLRRIREERFKKNASTALFTIGYEGLTLESYLNSLLQSDVTLLCDVRKNPISRKYGFSKNALSSRCGRVGIRYEHIPGLGVSSERRRNLKTQADRDALFDEYKARNLPGQDKALSKIQAWLSSGERVALTCYENLPEQCHRRLVADALARKIGKRTVVRNLP